MVPIDKYIISDPAEFDGKTFVSVLNADVETDFRRMSFEEYLPNGYRFPTAEELDAFCTAHPFFETLVDNIDKGYVFINDLGLIIVVNEYIDSWSGCVYGPMVICQESLDDQARQLAKSDWGGHVETCYDIRARRFCKYFDYRVLRHLILVKE